MHVQVTMARKRVVPRRYHVQVTKVRGAGRTKKALCPSHQGKGGESH